MSVSAAESPPRSFYCHYSNKLMHNPYLGNCSHLFDAEVVNAGLKCPDDGMPIVKENCTPLVELAKKIADWKKRLSEVESSLVDAVSDWSIVKKKTFKPIKEIKDAHLDDVHGFIMLGKDRFVSGSKDTSIKIWNNNGTLSKTLKSRYHAKGYQYWVTALTSLSDDYFASGSRDGYISIWDKTGEEVQWMEYRPSHASKEQYVAKERNKQRINCIKEGHQEAGNHILYTGTPRYVQMWSVKDARMLKYWEADNNDWVYCIEPLARDRLITVIGARMEIWTNIFDREMKKAPLITEERRAAVGEQRAHISAILRLEANRQTLATALFDGSVRCIDIQEGIETHRYQEHQKRVWSVIELRPHIIASSADDSLIKIWDLRQRSSIVTLRGNPGRVSALLKISSDVFISGSCPDNLRETAERATIRFWDIRQLLGENDGDPD